MAPEIREGSSSPLGATPSAEGVHFSIFSRNATGVELLLFDCADDARPSNVILIDPSSNRTYHYRHVFVPGSWFDWALVAKHADVHRFVTLLAARRLRRDVEHEHRRMSLNQLLRQAKIAWHGVKLGQPDWSPSSHSVAFTAEIRKEKLLFHLILNAYWEPLDFELPPVGNGDGNPWRRWIDTALDSPQDIVEWQRSPSITGNAYRAEPRSVVVLFAALDRLLDQEP